MSVLNPDTRKIDMNTYNVFLNIGLSYSIGRGRLRPSREAKKRSKTSTVAML